MPHVCIHILDLLIWCSIRVADSKPTSFQGTLWEDGKSGGGWALLHYRPRALGAKSCTTPPKVSWGMEMLVPGFAVLFVLLPSV